jgi:adenylate cyclase
MTPVATPSPAPARGEQGRKSAPRARRWWIAALLAFLLACLLRLADTQLFGLEARSLDLRFQLRGPRPVDHSPLVLVTVDNRSYKDLNQRWPFPRGHFARALRNLKRLGVDLIVLDIQFTEEAAGDEAGLAELAAAVRDCAPVILSGEMVYERSGYQRLDRPLPVLLEAGQPWALVNDLIDPDGVSRLYPLFLPAPLGGEALPSLGARLLLSLDSLAGRGDGAPFGARRGKRLVLGAHQPLLEPGWANAIRINFYGPGGTWTHYSFSDILDDADFTLADPDQDTDYVESLADTALYRALWGDDPHPFLGRVALVGVSATDLHDNKRTPFFNFQGQRRLVPGVEVHAHAVQTMLDGAWVRNPLPGWWAALPLGLLALAAAWVTGRMGPMRGLLALVALGVAWLAAGQWAFARHDLWLETVAPLSSLAAAWMTGVLLQFLQARRERAQIRGMFAQYVPEAVVAELIRNPDKLVLGGEEREMSALFSDVEGFTSISEHLTPTQLVELLNEYLTEMTQCVTDEGGIIDKYEGDAIIAEFGAPLPCADHAQRAARTALAMQERLAGLRRDWALRGKPQLKARVGINSGLMVVGNMGSRQIFDYTAMGDAMNLASRLEGVNKFYGSAILLSGESWARLERAFLGRCLDAIRVKGRREPVQLWELIARADDARAATHLESIGRWDAARAHYLARDFAAAAAAFEALAATDAEDGPARVLAARSRAFAADPPSADWDGVQTMLDK